MKKIIISIIGIFIILVTAIQIKAIPSVGWFGKSIWDSYSNLDDMKNEDITASGYYLFCTSKEDSIFLEDYGFRYLEIDTELELPFQTYEIEELSLYYLRESKKGDAHFRNLFDDLIKNSKYVAAIPVTVSGVHYLKYYDYKLHKPEFVEKNDSYFFNLSETKSLSYILNDFVVYDIIDGYLSSSSINVISDNYTPNIKKAGVYDVTIEFVNSVGNSLEHTFNIEIVNNTFPTITAPKTFFISSSFEMTNEMLLKSVHAKDFQGNSLTPQIKNDEYLLSKNPGNYKIDFSIIDNENQETTLSSSIEVINSTIPFYTDDNSNIIFNKYINLSEQEMIDILLILNPQNDWDKISVSPNIKPGVGYNYIYYEIIDKANKIKEDRLVFHFLTADISEEFIPIKKEKSYDFIFIIAIIGISLGATSYIIFKQYKKKSI